MPAMIVRCIPRFPWVKKTRAASRARQWSAAGEVAARCASVYAPGPTADDDSAAADQYPQQIMQGMVDRLPVHYP